MPASLDGVEFILGEVVTDLRRDRVISLSTIGIVALAILILGAMTLTVFNLRLWTDQLSSSLKVTLYLKNDVSRTRAIELRSEIAGWPKVTNASLILKEEAWEKFRGTHPVGKRLGTLNNPFTDAIEVQTQQTENRKETSQNLLVAAKKMSELKETKNIVPTPEELSSDKGLPQKILRFRSWVHIIALILAIAMGLAAFLIIHNTSRLSLYARRREIYIMQLVGATPTFIAAPFLLEGAVLGFLGALLACCGLVPLHMYLRALVANSGWTIIQLLPDSLMVPFALIMLLGAMLFGIAGAGLSLSRFLAKSVEAETH